jgi:recombination protein RecA
MAEEQQSALDFITADIRSRLKDPKIIYSLHDKVEKFPALPCGIKSIDDALGGGIPEGRICELYGAEGSGKTTVMLHFIAAAQRRGEIVFFVDAENALDLPYAERIGVNLKKMLFSQPDYGEQALDVMIHICGSVQDYNEAHSDAPMKALIVLDSVAALIPKQEFTVFEEKGMDQSVAMGARARMLSSKLPMVCNKASKSGVSVVFINQMRDLIGVTYGPTTTTPGGRALKFYASVRIKVSRIGLRKRGDVPIGIRSRLVPEKSKLFTIFDKKAEFYIGENGIDVVASIADAAVEQGAVQKSGAWLKFGDAKYQGRDKFEAALREDSSLLSQIQSALGGEK